MNAVSALFYLRTMSIKNAIVMRLKRLGQPKYLVGAMAGLAYFYWGVFNPLGSRHQFQSVSGATTSDNVSDLYSSSSVIVAALLCTIFVVLYWVWPRARVALTFTETEIVFLFPAPISRQTLIRYRIVNLALGLLLTALIFSLFSNRGSSAAGNPIIRFVGWWILLFILSLHSMAASFVTTRLFDRGVTSLRRQVFIGLGLLITVIAFGLWTMHVAPVAPAAELVDIDAIKNYLVILFNTAPLSWLLLPAKIAVSPALASGWASFLLSLLPALLLLVLHYYWILRCEVSFEEASIVKAEKRAATVAAIRAGKMRVGSGAPKVKKAPFNLNTVRQPELAFLWKNLLATASYLRLKNACYAFMVVVLGCYWIDHGDHQLIRTIVLSFSGICAGYVLFLGPMIARQDLRSDLTNTDVLKTYPLRGWQIVLGEVLTPVVVLTTLFWILLLAMSLCLLPNHFKWMTPVIHVGATAALAIIALLLCSIQLLLLNAATIMFPAWMQVGQGSPGIEVMGQRMLFMTGLLLVIILSLLPAVLFAALFFILTKWIVGIVIATTLATVTLIAILIIEIIFGVEWLGVKFEQFDLSAELKV